MYIFSEFDFISIQTKITDHQKE